MSYNPDATNWDGVTGQWWESGAVNQDVIDIMLSKSLQSLTNKTNDIESWNALFHSFNISYFNYSSVFVEAFAFFAG